MSGCVRLKRDLGIKSVAIHTLQVGMYFKSMLGREELPEKSAVSADQLQLPNNSHSPSF